MKLTCDNCKKEFVVKPDMLKENYLGAMLTETSFNCPKCDEKYFVCIQNAKCRELQDKIEALREIIKEKHLKKDYPIPEVLEIEELSKELKQEMNRINGK
ncbi:hypothetical protein [Clostridium tagluense]|uniref:hypothetical protein n=1 Tax=Clostridium tagluense TaxID=360422 RepID=UPI001CF18D8B|nr:hypothetical protein [Clostridium tagluense]MCB2300386.1 hypothetical protein [Clostridium tagluense]